MKPSEVKLILIHGAFVDHGGEKTTGRLRPWAEKYGFNDIHEFKYGRFDLIKVGWRSKVKAQELADIIGDKPTVAIGHSHGNVILDLAATDCHAPIIYHIGINPALSVNADFAPQVRKVDIYHTPGDRVVTLAKYYKWFTFPLLAFRKQYWGEAGRKGIKITEENKDIVTNFNMQDHPAGLPQIDGHSEFFEHRVLGHPQSNIHNDIWAPELFGMILYKLERMQPVSAVEQRADLFQMSVKLYEKALENYTVTYGNIRNGNALKLNFWSKTNREKITRPDDLVKYWAELGGDYHDGYFTV